MSRIVVESIPITGKTEVGPGCFILDVGRFSRLKFIRPGQFVHIGVPDSGLLFRRAFSVYDVDMERGFFSILFKVVGRGTHRLSQVKKNDTLDVLGPLGNGFKFPGKRETLILAAGGIGMPPIYFLAKRLVERNYDPDKVLFFYGAVSKSELVDVRRIKKLKTRIFLSTDDGSFGFKGFVTGVIKKAISERQEKFRIFACGPEGMLRVVDAMAHQNGIPGQFSLEAPMPCGLGICLGCIRPLAGGGYTRVCREGPVYDIGEVVL